uniref:Uncharacterized protein n=1 Tax=Sinocyclocheilus anshuiensis TaxID=1608454 RepID=A0A671LVU2_9TELE
MLNFFILMVNISKCSSDNADIVAQNHLKIVQAGDSVNFACIFPKVPITSAVWVKQRVGEKPLSNASSYQGLPGTFENDFDQHKRFFIVKDDRSFNLSITNTEESDTATYYYGTDLIVKEEPQDTVRRCKKSRLTQYKCFQTHWTTAALIIVILSVIVIIIMGAQLYKYRQKDGMHNTQHGQLMADDADALNYAALRLQQKPSTSRRPRERKSQDNSIYTHVRYQYI